MKLKMPNLRIGQSYKWTELTEVASDEDRRLVTVGFPKDIDRWPHENLLLYRPDEEIYLEYTEWSLDVLRPQLEELRELFKTDANHWVRVKRIKELLQQGEPARPVFVQKNDVQKKRIVEGMHRAVAFLELGADSIPVLLTKYADW
jgi:hypothetical protein